MSLLHRDERGSAAIEAAIGVPAFGLFVGLIIFGGRTAVAHESVQAAAAEAARTASIARSSSEASRTATDAARQSLRSQGVNCRSVAVQVDTSGFHTAIGEPAAATATVVCRLDLTDLSAPIPGSRTIRSTMSSPIDTWRERGDSR